MDSGIKTKDPLDVSQIFAEVIGRPLDIPGFEVESLTHSSRGRAVPHDVWVTFAFSQRSNENKMPCHHLSLHRVAWHGGKLSPLLYENGSV